MQLLYFKHYLVLGASASSLIIQKSSCRFSPSLRVSLLTFDISINSSIGVSFACFMKSWPCNLKWWHAGVVLGLLTSFLWLFSLKEKCAVDSFHYTDDILTCAGNLWNILKVIFVCWLIAFVSLLFLYSILIIMLNYKA